MSTISNPEDAIREVYRWQAYAAHAADAIARLPKVAQAFAADVNSLLPAATRLSLEECIRILVNMRRRGESNNGLPRKFH